MSVCIAGFRSSSSAPCFLLLCPPSKRLQSFSPLGFERPTHPPSVWSRLTRVVTWHFMHIVDLYWSLVICVCASCSGLRVMIPLVCFFSSPFSFCRLLTHTLLIHDAPRLRTYTNRFGKIGGFVNRNITVSQNQEGGRKIQQREELEHMDKML